MALLRLTSLPFYLLAIVAGLSKRLMNRIGYDAIDMGDFISSGGSDPDSARIRDIAEEWKRTDDRME
jgi:hypothetical protein